MAQLDKPIFRDLDAEDQDAEATEIESVCMNCYKNGITRLLLTKIPFYKEVVLMSFSCEFCGHQNNEIQSCGEIQKKGYRISLKVKTVKDLNRRIVKSDHTMVRIDELDFEIPAQSQKGEITTIEGVIDRVVSGLEQDQLARTIEHPEDAKNIEKFIKKISDLKEVKEPFTFILEDITGNCYIENPNVPQKDPNIDTREFIRTKDQDHLLGMFTQLELNDTIKEEDETDETKPDSILKPIIEGSWPLEELHGEVLQFKTLCPECGSPCDTNMKVTNIPHFKDVVIMATVCDVCGVKTNEVKSGGGIAELGTKIEVKIVGKEDFSRDVLKSEFCSLYIPELNCEVGSHTLGGRFTTVEGLLSAVKEQLFETGGMFRDSQDVETKDRMDSFIIKLEEILSGNKCITLILDDPTGNSYIQSLTDDGTLDDRLKISTYERNFEQNEELGLNDMKTENYEEK